MKNIIMTTEKAFELYKIARDNGADPVEYAKTFNADSVKKAVATLWNGNSFRWDAFVEGVEYPVINPEGAMSVADAVSLRTVKVSDAFCMRRTKNSTKAELEPVLKAMVQTFGANIGAFKHEGIKDAVSTLRVYGKFANAPKVFYEGTPSSKCALEKQLQIFADTLLTAEKAPKMLKAHVVHLADAFIRANAEGWRNGNEIALLQAIVEHIRFAKEGNAYKVKSSLACHKAPKEDATK